VFATTVPGPLRAFKALPRPLIKRVELVGGAAVIAASLVLGSDIASKVTGAVMGLLVVVLGLRADVSEKSAKASHVGGQRADSLGRSGGRLAATAIKAAKKARK
jgi:hypothetical protein